MKKEWLVKTLAIGIILLFTSITFAPNINYSIVLASRDEDFVEVTIQPCGIGGYENTTVKFTNEQLLDLQQYLVEFKARLNQTLTRAEVVPIFKEAVEKLDDYGLLPKGMSVNQALKLVTTIPAHVDVKKLMNSSRSSYSEFSNILCLLFMFSVAPGSDTVFGLLALPSVVFFLLFFKNMFHFYNPERAMFWLIPLLVSAVVGIPSLIFNYFSPILLWSVVIINSCYLGLSFGLKGVQQINQNIEYLIGFKGLRIWLPVDVYNNRISFFLGQALGTTIYP
jgi:hypothetical protein